MRRNTPRGTQTFMLSPILSAVFVVSVTAAILHIPPTPKYLSPADTVAAVVKIEVPAGHGSGAFIAPDKILTARHVVRGLDPNEISIVTHDRQVLTPLTITPAGTRDLAVLCVEPQAVTPLVISNTPPRLSEAVRVIGHPLLVGLHVAHGHVARSRLDASGLLRLDVDANPGHSGSPVLNERNEIIGVLIGGMPHTDICRAEPVDIIR